MRRTPGDAMEGRSEGTPAVRDQVIAERVRRLPDDLIPDGRRLRLLLALGAFLGVLLLGDLAAALLESRRLLGIDLRPLRPLRRDVGLREDGLDRALGHARLAVDAVDR